jgi:D-alanyl-D-alanine dipeptidase
LTEVSEAVAAFPACSVLVRPLKIIISSRRKFILTFIVLLCGFSFASAQPKPGQATGLVSTPKPAPAPARWRGLIGEYGPDSDIVYVLESGGKLAVSFKKAAAEPLDEVSRTVFRFPGDSSRAGQRVQFTLGASGRATKVEIDKTSLDRRQIEPQAGANQLLVKPLRPVPELIKEALKAEPPKETGDFRPSDLVELTKLDPTIRLEVRYATTNNLFGTVFYSQARAFLQRPAAEALVRVNKKLKPLGYGLLVHDAYRPWYVTKVFWDATPDDKKLFVADPSKGSRHNRGAAVDLTLYDLKTKSPIEMVSTYDETTDRAHPDYPGGTSLQRWHRDLLRKAMEGEGYTVFEAEWWHFDFNDWQKYPIGNQRFENIGVKGSDRGLRQIKGNEVLNSLLCVSSALSASLR